MARFVIVTGTDTGVGKTFVTEALARVLSRDRRVVAIKPFESGVVEGEPGDGERLAAATAQSAPRHALVRLRAPLAPALAADRELVTIDFDAVLRSIRAHAESADIVLIEGAGGARSPLTWDHDLLDLARALADEATALRMVVVASDRLGTISATHLVVDAIVAGGLSPPAIVLSAPALPDASTGTNAMALRRRLAHAGDTSQHVLPLPRTDGVAAANLLSPLARWLE